MYLVEGFHTLASHSLCYFFSLRARDQAIRDLKIERRDGNENVTQKWILVLLVFITIIPTHLLCQMQANPPDLNSKGPYPSLER